MILRYCLYFRRLDLPASGGLSSQLVGISAMPGKKQRHLVLILVSDVDGDDINTGGDRL